MLMKRMRTGSVPSSPYNRQPSGTLSPPMVSPHVPIRAPQELTVPCRPNDFNLARYGYAVWDEASDSCGASPQDLPGTVVELGLWRLSRCRDSALVWRSNDASRRRLSAPPGGHGKARFGPTRHWWRSFAVALTSRARKNFPSCFSPPLLPIPQPHSVGATHVKDNEYDRLQPCRVLSSHTGADFSGMKINYHTSLSIPGKIPEGSVDMVVSQAVMEHVSDILRCMTLFSMVKPWHCVTQIDSEPHETTPTWNGHWAYSDMHWNFIIGLRRGLLLNREPCSRHLAMLRKSGLMWSP